MLLFSDPSERAKALGIWAGIAGLGGVLGSVISGLVTDTTSWRWIFFINVPVALFALTVVPRITRESRMSKRAARLDLSGAILSTIGLIAVVYALLQAADNSWVSLRVLGPLSIGAILIALFAWAEARTQHPLFPLTFFSNRTRVGANVAAFISTASFFTFVFVLTLFEQQVLGFTPLAAGLSYLPFGVAIGVGVGVCSALMPRLGVKALILIGFTGSAVGLLIASTMQPGSVYLTGILPAMIVLGLFTGVNMPAFSNAALHQVTQEDSSLASGVQQATQAIGGAVGLATLVTLAVRHAAQLRLTGLPAGAAATQGYGLALRLGAVTLIVGAVLLAFLMEPHVKGNAAVASVEPSSPKRARADEGCAED